MTYSAGGLIQASDFNLIAGPSATPSSSESVNTVWGVGNGRWGYGQTPISNVSANALVTSSNWNSLVSTIDTILNHQGINIQYARTGTFVSGSYDVAMTYTDDLYTSMCVAGPGIQFNSIITAITPGVKITLDKPVTASSTTKLLFSFSTRAIPPQTDDKIAYMSSLTGWVYLAYLAKNNAILQGTTTATTTTATLPWKDKAIFTHTVTFESPDKARYFFNAGGQIAINFGFTSPTSSAIDVMFNTLATACGTVVLSAPPFGTSATIATVTYNGTTKIGGSGTATVATSTGYYDLYKTPKQIFSQKATGTPAGYLNSTISVNASSNGTQGTHADAGSTITLQTVWDQVPNGIYVTGGSTSGVTTTVTVRYPSTSFLTNTWGTVKVGATHTET